MHQPLFHRLNPRQLLAIDAMLAFVALLANQYAALDAAPPGAPTEPAWLSSLAATAIAAPVAVRRFWPVPALAVAMTATFASLVTGVIPAVAVAAPLGAVAALVYLVASTEPQRMSLTALAACLVSFAAAIVIYRAVRGPFETWLDSLSGILLGWLILAAGWTIGLTTLQRRRYTEQAAAQHAQQAVAEERLRIARELHDIVAHSMSLIAVKAGIGNHVATQRPEEARDALRVIEQTSRGSLAEMRHLLGVLRSEVDNPDLSPAPGPGGIPALAERARSAGVEVTLDLTGTSTLPDGVGLSVYRIVQEALTNVVRHAAPATGRVRVEATGQDERSLRSESTFQAAAESAEGAGGAEPAERSGATQRARGRHVRIEVTNDGPRVAEPDGAGHGLIGMRERVAMYGGTFQAGPRAEGGFAVSAVLPVDQHWSGAKERSPSVKWEGEVGGRSARRRASAEHATREDGD